LNVFTCLLTGTCVGLHEEVGLQPMSELSRTNGTNAYMHEADYVQRDQRRGT